MNILKILKRKNKTEAEAKVEMVIPPSSIRPTEHSSDSILHTRPDWDVYFMQLADMVASRSTCIRRHVGAIAVDSRHRVLGTGYNGVPSGYQHCTHDSCIRIKQNIPSGERQELCSAIHAEENIVLQLGEQLRGATLYCTIQPCTICIKSLIGAGINRIVWQGSYPDKLSLDMMRTFGVVQEITRDNHTYMEFTRV